MQNLQTMPLRATVTAQSTARSAKAWISHVGRRFAGEERGEMAAWLILTIGLVAMAVYASKTLGDWNTKRIDTIATN